MIRKLVLPLVAALACSTLQAQSNGLGLEFNGQTIVPVGQVEDFEYHPSIGLIEIRTFFGDIRCKPSEQGMPGDRLMVSLDGFSMAELDANSLVASSGGVSYVPSNANGMISIITADGASPGCEHRFPAVAGFDDKGDKKDGIEGDGSASIGAFAKRDFERLVEFDFDPNTMVITQGVDQSVTVVLKVINRSEDTVLRDVRVLVGASIDGENAPELMEPMVEAFPAEDEVEPVDGPGNSKWIWTINLLYPRGTAACDRAQDDVYGCAFLDFTYATKSGEIPGSIELKSALLRFDDGGDGSIDEATDRTGENAIDLTDKELITVVNTDTSTISVVNTSTAFP